MEISVQNIYLRTYSQEEGSVRIGRGEKAKDVLSTED